MPAQEGWLQDQKPQKEVVRGWLWLPELAAPQSDHQLVALPLEPPGLALLPQHAGGRTPPSGLRKKFRSPMAQVSPYLAFPLPPFCLPYLTTTLSGPSFSLPSLRREICQQPLPTSVKHPKGRGPRTWSLPPQSQLKTASCTSRRPSSAQMEIIWLRLHTDFTNNYVMLIHTHSHITSS